MCAKLSLCGGGKTWWPHHLVTTGTLGGGSVSAKPSSSSHPLPQPRRGPEGESREPCAAANPAPGARAGSGGCSLASLDPPATLFVTGCAGSSSARTDGCDDEGLAVLPKPFLALPSSPFPLASAPHFQSWSLKPDHFPRYWAVSPAAAEGRERGGGEE